MKCYKLQIYKTNIMKNKFFVLTQLSNELNFDYFYSVAITSNWIKLQGEFSTEKLNYFKDLGIEFNYNKKGNWYISSYNLKLTDMEITIEILLTL